MAWRSINPTRQGDSTLPKSVNAGDIAAPFSNYSHGMLVSAESDLLFCSGQLGNAPDGSVPEGCAAQAEQCFANAEAILRAAGMGLSDVVRINAYVTAREHMAPYMEVRNRLFAEPYPASTLVIVSGFSRPEFVVEVEVVAARRS
ncbi:RidA family protein [Neoaquamicrobium sediminum]|uniref:RidA family protein n=1 Tax=Neoaquamicrobium sediminum TaxID=1849104 RepID=UPI004037201B